MAKWKGRCIFNLGGQCYITPQRHFTISCSRRVVTGPHECFPEPCTRLDLSRGAVGIAITSGEHEKPRGAIKRRHRFFSYHWQKRELREPQRSGYFPATKAPECVQPACRPRLAHSPVRCLLGKAADLLQEVHCVPGGGFLKICFCPRAPSLQYFCQPACPGLHGC